MRIIALSTTACLIEDCEPPDETSETWLKLPHKGPIQVMIEPAPHHKLLCTFCKPLYPAEVEALAQANPVPGLMDPRRPRPRCSFL